MAKNFRELRDRMSPERREANEARAKEELGRILVRDLRRMAGMTQTQLADSLGIAQPNVSKMESREDVTFGTFQRLVEAVGGQVSVTVKMPTASMVLDLGDAAQGWHIVKATDPRPADKADPLRADIGGPKDEADTLDPQAA